MGIKVVSVWVQPERRCRAQSMKIKIKTARKGMDRKIG